MESSAGEVLTASRYEYGDKIARAEPTFCLQTPQTKASSPCCYRCLKPLGSLYDQVVACKGEKTLREVFLDGRRDKEMPWSPRWARKLQPGGVYLCPRGCGAAFCSEECFRRADEDHHDVLCVGNVTEEDPIYKYKVLTLEHGLLVYELLAQVVVHQAKQKEPSGWPGLGLDKAEGLMPFWDYVADYGPSLAGCYREEVLQVAESLSGGGGKTWRGITEDCFGFLATTLEEKGLPGAARFRAEGVDHFAKTATWLDMTCISVDHLSPAGRYIDGVLKREDAGDIARRLEDAPELKEALYVFAEEDNDVEDLQDYNDEGELYLPSVSALMFWEGATKFTHSCKPSIALSFSPLESKIDVQANHLLGDGAGMTRCYLRDSESHSETLDFLKRIRMECSCSTCRTREFLEGFEGGQPRQGDLSALDALGKLAFDEERYSDACELYEKRLEVSKQDGETWHNYGRALVNMGRWSKGYEAWKLGAEVTRESGSPHDELETLMAAHRYFTYRTTDAEDRDSAGAEPSEEDEADDRLPRHLRQDAFFLGSPVMTLDECKEIIDEAESHAREKNGWSTKRHYSVPTTDLPAHALPGCLGILNRSLRDHIFPAIASKFGEELEDLQVHDAFVIKYSMDGQKFLPIHTDQSHYSATIGLNPTSEYGGGGIIIVEDGGFEEGEGHVVKVEEGGAFVFRGGELSHGGRNITSGIRYIIALFIFSHREEEEDVEDIEEEEDVEEEEEQEEHHRDGCEDETCNHC
ncbi:hypothetical protein A3770_11p63660 [Chloropicon primus]|uniref:Fe2OG dioxygenase domain-containing protein n=1 Tax=Chloropicon primus TaxID=1764295 RepID=A0A5B8MSU2_9CHLO|nr:hypothetical protein A3770_11p63660 [Chloropicon primus]|eukprot:QDZ23848.1 hypothetical protein A3770_11p63660 [Chloropicon primus]